MKPLFIILTALTTVFSSASFANSTKPNPGTDKVAPAALKSFESSFGNAQEVDWSVTNNYYKVVFAMNGQYITAFYGNAGNLMGLTRNISSTQLPISLQAELKKEYSEFWISDLFEVANDEGTHYYITIENSETKLVLKGSTDGSWSTFQKSRKA
jgi:mRNA deadenylase 3'-5' endonuclease subunit Ccr4